jgi:spore coat polysaccharide biosynthesis predicted glycosyltransferase SpsG
VWVVDLEGGCPPSLAERLSSLCRALVILNGVRYPDGDPGRLHADLVFYQGVTRRPYDELDWTGFEGEWFEGPEWLILRRRFREVRARPGTHDPPRIVVAGGGSDPQNVTQLVIDALKGMDYQIRAIVGPAKKEGLGYDPRKIEVICDPPDMAEALAWGDAAVVSYGMTAFECLALGLPAVALSISLDHAMSAALLQDKAEGAFVSLGTVAEMRSRGDSWLIPNVIETMLEQVETFELSKAAHETVDGLGAERVADKIMEVLDE